MRSFYMDLPEELADAARVEGATEFQVFRRIMLPLSTPGGCGPGGAGVLPDVEQLPALPLVYLQGSENQMLASGPLPVRGGSDGRVRVMAAAASLIMTVPVIILFLIFQKYFIRGLTAGAFK